MRIGIDSYSYHRRYGELRPGEAALPGPAWPLEPSPVIEHARSLGVDDLMLETCYLPEPEAMSAETLGGDDRPRSGSPGATPGRLAPSTALRVVVGLSQRPTSGAGSRPPVD